MRDQWLEAMVTCDVCGKPGIHAHELTEYRSPFEVLNVSRVVTYGPGHEPAQRWAANRRKYALSGEDADKDAMLEDVTLDCPPFAKAVRPLPPAPPLTWFARSVQFMRQPGVIRTGLVSFLTVYCVLVTFLAVVISR